ncbi:hypothetical protein RRG08_037060 [Elysia crispata]|uniref:Uncharacterized protein n=1 Tax=Elysia crispata TaxID=231223 RepID=A0AAE0ZW15_9GAST|nr:hypothetical protein RRG08_037060 [Elysia crispata]
MGCVLTAKIPGILVKSHKSILNNLFACLDKERVIKQKADPSLTGYAFYKASGEKLCVSSLEAGEAKGGENVAHSTDLKPLNTL